MPKKVVKEEKKQNIVKRILNNPKTIIVVLCVICISLLIYIVSFLNEYNENNKIFAGSVETEMVEVASVHYFTNKQMNYFFASPANYIGEDKKVYIYEIGYYAVDKNKRYIPLAVRNGKLDKASSLKEIVDENSAWDFAELDGRYYNLSEEALKNIDNLHFVIHAGTESDSNLADINIDNEVKMTKLTK